MGRKKVVHGKVSAELGHTSRRKTVWGNADCRKLCTERLASTG